MAVFFNIALTIFLIFTLNNVICSKLNVPRVLLPYKTSISTNYTLEVTDGGCYKWSSSRPEVAIVTPVLDEESSSECSTKAVVSAVSRSPSRQSTIILATDEGTDTVLKCDVIIDCINSLEIVTTTRELFLDDAPEAFEVHAKNDQEDTFTSIEGLTFNWKLETSGSEDTSVLRFLTFESSPYETPQSIDYWERQGLKGHIVLVEGLSTGAASVSVQLLDSNLKHVIPSTVTLIVVANLMLNPAHDVYILPHSSVHYKVELIKQGRSKEIKMPSDQYKLELKNAEIGSLDSSTSDVTGVTFGSTHIVLNDKNTSNLAGFRQPSAGIHVVKPHFIGFDIKPGSWVLQTENRYEVFARLFTLDNQEIYPSDNLRLKVSFPEKYFKVEHSSDNGSYHVIHTKTSGKAKINGKLESVIRADGSVVPIDFKVENDQLVDIYDKVVLIPKQLAFPWDPVHKHSYSGKLGVAGGSGSYTWKVTDTSVVQVKKYGAFSTMGAGKAVVTVYDANNKLNYDTMEIFVLEVSGIETLPGVVEAMVDAEVFLPMVLYGYTDKEKKNSIKFEDCSKVNLDIEMIDRRFFRHEEEVENPPYPGACRTLTFTAKYQGHTRINFSYRGKLNTTTVIAAFKTLMPLSPPSVALLPLGTSREIVFEGGPRPWVLKEDSHYTILDIKDKDAVKSVMLYDAHRHVDLHVFGVTCHQVTETEVTLRVGNEPSATNKLPASQKIKMRTACAIPKRLSLRVVTKECKEKRTACPKSGDVVKMPVQTYEDIEIEVRVSDSFGRQFDNVSSLAFEWSVSDSGLGKLSDDEEVQTHVNAVKGFRKPTKHFQKFHPRGLEGLVRIKLRLTGYKEEMLREQGIEVNDIFDDLSAVVDIELVEKASVDSEKVSVFNHPENKAVLKLSKGSGHFIFETSNDKLADISLNEEESLIEITPKNNGTLTLSIYDICACTEIISEIKISSIHSIEVSMSDKVELGKDIEADIRILDETGNPLSVSIFSLINLKPVTTSTVISVRPSKASKTRFSIRGESLGQTSLMFQATSNTQVISSHQHSIQVFSPFILQPKAVTLIKGAKFQVASHGGPEPQLNIEFLIDNPKIALVSNAGIITASAIGSTKVVGNVLSDDTTPPTIYCKDEVNIEVVQLSAIKIQIPLTRIQTNSEIPVYVNGINDQENPFSFGTSDPPLKIKWTISNTNIADIKSSYHKVAIHSKDSNNFAIRLVTKEQGQVTIKVEVVDYEGTRFHDEIQLNIFEKLKTKSSNDQGLSILMTPNTETYLKTNRDGIADMNFEAYSESLNGLISIDSRSGRIISNDKTGDAIIHVIARESFGILQKMAVVIEVKPVSYLMITAETSVKSSASLQIVPLGLKLKFSIGFYDNVGKKFDATSCNAKHRLSRFDLLHLSPGYENNTFVVHASKEGQTILKVWSSQNSKIVDYIKVDVGNSINPVKKSLTLGDVICFSSQLLSDDGHSGFWYSSGANQILNFVNNDGIVSARNIGSTSLYYNVSSSLITSTEIIVKPISSVQLDGSLLTYVTNDFDQSFNVPVHLLNEDQVKLPHDNYSCHEKLPKVEKNFRIFVPFACEISFTDNKSGIEAREVFVASAAYNTATGQHQCQIKALQSLASGFKHQLSSIQTNLEVIAHVYPQGKDQKEILSKSLIIPFHPLFFMHSEDITLSNTQSQANLEITSSPQFQHTITVTSSDSNLFEVLPPESDVKNPSNLIFTVKLRDPSSLWDTGIYKNEYYLSMKGIENGQKLKIPIKLLLHRFSQSGQCAERLPRESGWFGLFQAIVHNYQNWVITTLSIIGTAAALFIGYRAVFGQSTNSSLQNSAFLQQSHLSNSHFSHGYDNSWGHSPMPTRTPSPKPYLYSVDNTSPNMKHRNSPYSSY